MGKASGSVPVIEVFKKQLLGTELGCTQLSVQVTMLKDPSLNTWSPPAKGKFTNGETVLQVSFSLFHSFPTIVEAP